MLFWMVWGAEKAALEVNDYHSAIAWASQTALREVIGQMNLADILIGRAKMDADTVQAYINNPTALHLRAMNMLFEGLKEKGARIIVPSSAV